jgi:hypothetical protein
MKPWRASIPDGCASPKDSGCGYVYVDGRWQADFSPEENTAPLDSDVTAWRLAWKLAQAGRPDTARFKEGDLVNITVVDDQGDRVRSYMTNAFEMYHPHEVKSGG